MFVVSLSYKVDLAEVDQHLDAHVAYLKKQYEDGYFLASGRKEPRTGGVILAKAGSKGELQSVLQQDPFYQHALADYEVIEFLPTMTTDALALLKDFA